MSTNTCQSGWGNADSKACEALKAAGKLPGCTSTDQKNYSGFCNGTTCCQWSGSPAQGCVNSWEASDPKQCRVITGFKDWEKCSTRTSQSSCEDPTKPCCKWIAPPSKYSCDAHYNCNLGYEGDYDSEATCKAACKQPPPQRYTCKVASDDTRSCQKDDGGEFSNLAGCKLDCTTKYKCINKKCVPSSSNTAVSLADCQKNCGPTPPPSSSFVCSETGCHSIDKPPGDGRYKTQAECQAACTKPIPPTPVGTTSFVCSPHLGCHRVKQSPGKGRYSNYSACMAACKEPSSPSSTSSNTPLIIGATLGGLALIGLLIYLWLRTRRRQRR